MIIRADDHLFINLDNVKSIRTDCGMEKNSAHIFFVDGVRHVLTPEQTERFVRELLEYLSSFSAYNLLPSAPIDPYGPGTINHSDVGTKANKKPSSAPGLDDL